jgi:hypothetical protein
MLRSRYGEFLLLSFEENEVTLLQACTDEEKQVFEGIARGGNNTDYPTEIIQSLMNKQLLDDRSGFIMIPAMVLMLWHNEQAPVINDPA